MTTNLSRPLIDSVGPLVTERQAVRKRLTEWRMALSETDYRRINSRICANLLACLADPSHKRGTLAVFNPIRREPDLATIYQPLQQLGYQLALPMVVKRNAPLQFLAWQPGMRLVPDAAGIGVPAKTASNQYITPTLLVIPCVGFDRRGYRLGYGGGYYDRTLAQLQANTVGVGFAACEIKNLTELETDLPLQKIVTEHAML
jgi:5-formyltetrahydrofolate cyclo-ligase